MKQIEHYSSLYVVGTQKNITFLITKVNMFTGVNWKNKKVNGKILLTHILSLPRDGHC